MYTGKKAVSIHFLLLLSDGLIGYGKFYMAVWKIYWVLSSRKRSKMPRELRIIYIHALRLLYSPTECIFPRCRVLNLSQAQKKLFFTFWLRHCKHHPIKKCETTSCTTAWSARIPLWVHFGHNCRIRDLTCIESNVALMVRKNEKIPNQLFSGLYKSFHTGRCQFSWVLTSTGSWDDFFFPQPLKS